MSSEFSPRPESLGHTPEPSPWDSVTFAPFNYVPRTEKPNEENPPVSSSLENDSNPDELLRLSPLEQLEKLSSFENRVGEKNKSAVLDNLSKFKNNPATTPLVKIVTEQVSSRIEDLLLDDNDDYTDPFFDFELMNKRFLGDYIEDTDPATEHENLLEQERLHEMFPAAPDYLPLRLIASDVAASVIGPSDTIDTLFDASGNTAPLNKNFKNNALNVDKDITYLLKTIHHPDLFPIISERLGLNLTEIPLASQIELLKFMTEADDGRFDNLCQTLHKLNPDLRKKLATNLLAADFGPDFGDALLDIANSPRLSPEQIGDTLDKIDSCRASIKSISSLYSNFRDKDFASSYARAANERLTDALTAFRKIAKTGSAKANLGWFGQTDFNFENALEALEYERKSLEIISGALKDVSEGKSGAFAERILKPDERRGRSLYNFYSPDYGYVLLYTRPEGSGTFDSALEYGKIRSKYDKTANNAGVEASISLIVNPVDPYSLPNPFRPNYQSLKNPNFYDPATMDKVSAIRLDREGRPTDTPANDPNRDPISPIGTVSVDLAAINDRADTPSGKIARLISTGNALRTQSEASLNHNTNWFNQSHYGTADGFRSLVEYLDALSLKWCIQHPPKSNEGFSAAAKSAKNPARSTRAA